MIDPGTYVEIMNVVYSYPDRIDSGDFAGVGALFADAIIDMGDGQTLSGSADVQAYFERWTRRYDDDGTPHTRHCINNPIVEIDDSAGTAVVRYYITVFQRTDELPLQPVWANKYEDRLRRIDGRWRFVHRRGYAHLPGNIDHHLLQTPPQIS
jgi:ketosteroid isomerase-like protein